MAYNKQTWADGSGGGTPLSATRLNFMETGIDEAADDADTGIANAATAHAAADAAQADADAAQADADTNASAISTLDSAAVKKATLTAKGDTYAATGSATVVRKAVGANKTVLTADSAQSTGTNWKLPDCHLIGTYTGNGTDTTLSFTVPQTFQHLRLIGRLSHTNTTSGIAEGRLRFNSDTGNNYNYTTWSSTAGDTLDDGIAASQARIYVPVGTVGVIDVLIPNYQSGSGIQPFMVDAWGGFGTSTFEMRKSGGRYEIGANPLTDVRIFVFGENWSASTKVSLYGFN